MKCPKCSFENVDGSTYCINCGSRLDGKVRCPKCGEFLEPDAESCSHCGYTVPHNKEASSNGFNDKRERIKFVFNRVFAIVSIVLFSLAILEVWGFYLSYKSSGDINFWTGSAVYYLVLNIIDAVNITITEGLSPAELTSLWFGAGFQFLVMLINIVIVTTASIFGLIKSINALKTNTYKCYLYLAVVLLSHAVCLFLLTSFANTFEYGKEYLSYEISGSKSFFDSQIGVALLIMFISEAFFQFDKTKKAKFITLVLISLVAIVGYLYLESYQGAFINYFFDKDVTYNYGLGYFLMNRISEVGLGGSSNNISLLILSIALFVLFLLVVTLLVSSILYTVIHYFNRTYERHHFYIPLYYMSITLLVILTMCLIITIAINVIVANELGVSVLANYGIYPVALIYAGFPFASVSMIRNIKANNKLAEQTSVIESK